MGNDIVKAEARSLTVGAIEQFGWLIERPINEMELDAEQFAQVVAIANAPAPVLELPCKGDIRAHLAPLAGTLKTRSGSAAQGRMQLAIYLRVLQDVPVYYLAKAALHFATHSEWMPTPAEVRRQALTYRHPAELAHSRARYLVRQRRARIHSSLLLEVRQKRLNQQALDDLPPMVRDDAIAQRLLVPTPEGGVAYPSAETWRRWLEFSAKEISVGRD